MATQLKKTVKPSGGDYTSLEACMNANEQNLVTADKYFDVEIDGTWESADTTSVVIHNYTTSTSQYINIYTTAAARHSGSFYDTGCYKLAPATTNAPVLQADSNSDTSCTKIKGIIFDGTAITSSWLGVVKVAQYDANVTFAYNIIKARASVTGLYALHTRALRGTNLIYNNILFNSTGNEGRGYYIEDGGTNTYFYNNTVYGCAKGVEFQGGISNASNNLVLNCGTACFVSLANLTAGSNNVTSDATGDDSPLTSGQVSKTAYSDYFTNVTGGSEDFHLKSTCEFIGDGADLSATFTDDIDGDTRPTGANTWDIGADEYVAAVSGWVRGGKLKNII